MQNHRFLGAIVAGAALVSGAAYAQPSGESGGQGTLTASADASQAATIAGMAWRCEGDQCLGHNGRRSTVDGLLRECKRVVAVIGPVSSYSSRGRELTPGQVRACNRRAVRIESARN